MKIKIKLTILGIILLLYLHLTSINTEKALKVIFLDVGQGNATLIITPENHHILIDAGPDNKVISKLAKYIPLYNRKIDLFILTHPDKDHIFGSISLLERYNVSYTLNAGNKENSPLWEKYIKNHNETKFLTASPRQKIITPTAKIEILSPYLVNKEVKKSNNASLIIKLSYKDTKILITGDAEKESEKWLIQTYKEKLQSDILLAGHHGSKTSTTKEFIEAVNPKHTILSYGENNWYRHPHPTVINNLKDTSTKIHHTKDGDIYFEIK